MLENQVFPIPRDSLQIGGNQKDRRYELMDKDEYRDISLHHIIRRKSNKFSQKIHEFDRLFKANRETPENVTEEQVRTVSLLQYACESSKCWQEILVIISHQS